MRTTRSCKDSSGRKIKTTKDIRLFKIGDLIPESHCDIRGPREVHSVGFECIPPWGGQNMVVTYHDKGEWIISSVAGHINKICANEKQKTQASKRMSMTQSAQGQMKKDLKKLFKDGPKEKNQCMEWIV